MKNQKTNLRESILSANEQIIFEGRIRETEFFPSINEFNKEVQNIKRLQIDDKSSNLAIIASRGAYFSKKKRKRRIQQLKHIIPTTMRKTDSTRKTSPSFSSTTNVRHIFLIISDPGNESLIHPSNENFSIPQQLATLVLHDGKGLDVIQKMRYSFEYSSEKNQNFTVPMIKLTGWTIIAKKKIARVDGYLRRLNTDFHFRKYYSPQKIRLREYAQETNLNNEDDEMEQIIQQATTIKSYLCEQLDNILHDTSQVQRNQGQGRLKQTLLNEMADLQAENKRLRELLTVEENKNKEMEAAATEDNLTIIKEGLLKRATSNPQQPNSIEEGIVNLKDELDATENALEVEKQKEMELATKCEELKNDIEKYKKDESDLLTTMDRLKKKTAKRILAANRFGVKK